MMVRTNLKAGQALEILQPVKEFDRSYNLQYETLQNRMSTEDRKYALVSDILSDTYESAKNSLGNLR